MTAATTAAVGRRFPGVAESARLARDFARGVLGRCHPAADTVDLLTTELFTNAIAYTRSGWTGGTVTVTVQAAPDGEVTVLVSDDGSCAAPQLAGTAVGLMEHGRGLRLVDVLADEWGSDGGPAGRTVWFRCGGDW